MPVPKATQMVTSWHRVINWWNLPMRITTTWLSTLRTRQLVQPFRKVSCTWINSLLMITWFHGSISSSKNSCITKCDDDFLVTRAIDCGNLLAKECKQLLFAVWVKQKVTPVPWELVHACDFAPNTLTWLSSHGFFDAAGDIFVPYYINSFSFLIADVKLLSCRKIATAV